MPACQTCAADNSVDARFCAACGDRLPAPVAAREVRKTVTVLFADVVGSTELGERLDPEAVRGLMGGYFSLARSVIERHGGTIEKFIGDAVMAVFGVPVVHEDDALRAVRAAAELRDAIGRSDDLAIRVGVDTGEVIAGDASDRQTFVTGDTVNVAARLQAAGSAGDILLGPATVTLVRDAVSLGPPIALQVKGRTRPVEARWLIAVTGTEGRRRRPDAPLVGRGHELAALERTWATVAADRRPSLVTLVAPPGVGKSRLVAEFAARRAADAEVLTGHCLSYGEGITFWPIREIVNAAAGISERDGPEAGRSKLEALLAGEPDADVLVRRASSAIGLSVETAPQEELFWAIRRLLEAVARRRPLLVVVEDLHWAEPSLLDLIEYAVDLATDVPLLVLATARPELLEGRPGWAAGRPNTALTRLEPLGGDAAKALLTALPGGDVVPDSLRMRILAVAEGTPLYLEEFVGLLRDLGHIRKEDDGHWVADDDLGMLVVPPTVRALLSARLEGLPAPERILAERASVVGRSFESAVLAELDPDLSRDLGRRLLALVRKELLRPDQAVLTSGDAFRFRHVLIRDAAYEALPKAERAILHERVAGWLERTAGERLAEYEEIVGYHLEAAHRYRTELGETGAHLAILAERAGIRLAAAGERALQRGDMAASEGLLSRAATAFPVGSPARLRLLPDLGFALSELGRISDAHAVLRSAVEEATTADEPVLAIRAELEAAQIRAQTIGEYREPLETAQAAIPRLEREGDDVGLARAHMIVAGVMWGNGQIAQALARQERALGYGARVADARTQHWNTFWGVDFYGPAPAVAAIGRLEGELASAPAEPARRAGTLYSLTALYAMRSRIEDARDAYRDALLIFEELGASLSAAMSCELGGHAELIIGDPGRAESWLARGIVELERIGATGYLSGLLGVQSIAVARQGRAEEAIHVADRAIRIATPEDVITHLHAQTGRAIALLRLGDLPAAIETGRNAVRMARATDLVGFHINALMALAEALGASGDRFEAAEAATRALELSVDKEDLMDERRAGRLLERLTTSA